jgi:serine O-acetyltransferase
MTVDVAPSTPPASPAVVPPAAVVPAHNIGDKNGNPAGIALLALLREDLRTHDGDVFEQGFWAIAVHRFGNWRMGLPKLLRMPCTLLYRFLYKFVEWTCGITLPYTVYVGRRVRIWHHGAMILHAHRIGDDVHIRQSTTFGVARRNQNFQLPTIEDRCDLGVGVVALGQITIGHDSVIGANSVVLKDVPPWSVAVGAPARVVKTLQPQAGAGEHG